MRFDDYALKGTANGRRRQKLPLRGTQTLLFLSPAKRGFVAEGRLAVPFMAWSLRAWSFRAWTLTAWFLLLFLLTGCGHAPAQAQTPRVAVFVQPNFLAYGVPALLSPQKLASDLRVTGVPVDELDADALADPARFNVQKYAALILPYGNAYPQPAFANLKTFHGAGGCFVLSGIPFTHPVLRDFGGQWHDLGHVSDPALFGPDGIGVGGFRPAPPGLVRVAPGDPLKLATLGLDWGRGGPESQTLDTATLLPTNRARPALTAGGQPTAALVTHLNDAFPDTVDVWTSTPLSGDDPIKTYATEQLLERGTLAALAQKGLLTAARQKTAFAALDRLPRPRVYADITLPAPPRPYPALQPKRPAPARHLYVADVRHLDHDTQLLLFSLQGLVNRTQPRLYFLHDGEDQFWLDVMQQQGHTDKPIVVADPLSLLKTFEAAYKGVVVADPKVYVTPCLTVDIAGADNLLIATPELAAKLNLPIKSDLRGKFHDDADALRYARTQLLPRLNPYLCLCLDPPLLGSQVDDVIAARGMAFWVTGPKAQDRPGANMAAERAEVEATLAQMPLNAIVRGYWWHGDDMGLGETGGVALGSRFGKITTVSDYVGNYSVLSGIALPALKQKPQPPAPKYDPAKVYVAFALSDGDNLSTWRGVWRNIFNDPLHGTFPVAYGLGPTLADVAPPMAQWYYDHSAPTDEFICDVSGAGYIYPQDWAANLKNRPAAYASYYNWTQRYMTRLDIHGLRIMGVGRADIARAGTDLPGVPFFLPDYGPVGEKSYPEMTYTLPTGQPVFRAMSYGPGADKLADEIRSRVGKTRPAFVNAFVFLWGASLRDIKGALNTLGPEYVAVTPSQLNALYRQAQKVKEP